MKRNMFKSALLATLFTVGALSLFTGCKDDDDNGPKDTVTFGTPAFSATILKAEADVAGGKITIPYEEALGSEEYTVKVAVSGAGSAGITVADKSVKLTTGSGNIELAVTGKPTTAGAVTFTISGIKGLIKNTIDATVTAADAQLAFGTPTFAATKIQATIAIEGGKISIPYTDAKGTEQYTISVAATGAGSAGINAVSNVSKTLAAGNGKIELDITGTPTTAGAVTFTISGITGLGTTTVASTVTAAPLSFGTPTFAATKIQATAAIEGGKLSIPYTGAVGTEQYTISVAATGAGSAGINAVSNVSKTLAAGNGKIELDITGTPTTAGAVTFTISGIAGLSTTTVATTVAAVPVVWATGNLISDGQGGAISGTATDGGLYFQFGSLIGWSGGVNGDGTGTPVDGLALKVKAAPNGYTGSTTVWNPSWEGDPTTEDVAAGTGDPCKYYLKGTWRLPTKDECEALFKDNGYPSAGPWKWNGDTKSAEHKDGLKFPTSGYRHPSNSSLAVVGWYGYYWSASPYDSVNGYYYSFGSSSVEPSRGNNRTYGFSVRCVRPQ